jgi:hypothetical protein
MQDITISLTETEFKALNVAALSPQEWAKNAVKSRAQIAIDEIVQLCVAKSLEEQVQIPSSKEEIVDLAIAKGWVKIASSEVSNG